MINGQISTPDSDTQLERGVVVSIMTRKTTGESDTSCVASCIPNLRVTVSMIYMIGKNNYTSLGSIHVHFQKFRQL